MYTTCRSDTMKHQLMESFYDRRGQRLDLEHIRKKRIVDPDFLVVQSHQLRHRNTVPKLIHAAAAAAAA